MKFSKDCEYFPYSSKLVCYFEADQYGNISQLDHTEQAISAAYQKAIQKQTKIYAVWPGNYRSDLFEINDLNALADAFGVSRPDDHVHDIEWSISSMDDGKSSYALVDIVFKCGCSLDFNNIKKFANDMKLQKGWVVATSTGISGSYNGKISRYIIHVRRCSLNP